MPHHPGEPWSTDDAPAALSDLFGMPETAGHGVLAAAPEPALQALAATLAARWGPRCRLGTSSWSFPGWPGVWSGRPDRAALAREGLAAYAAHPLLRCVSLDRAFYRPPDAATLARLAGQTPPDFRFVVKAPARICDAQRRGADGRPLEDNPDFLDPALALAESVRPSAAGLGTRLGVLVFQLSPLPPRWLADRGTLHARLRALLAAVVPALPAGAVAALEVRDPALLEPALARLLRDAGVRWCLGLHDRLPHADAQLPMLRAMWPGDLVCRWNLQRGLRYGPARDRFAPFDRLHAPDPATREVLARVAAATLDAGHRVFVTVNNKAEGSAPLSVAALAQSLAQAPAAADRRDHMPAPVSVSAPPAPVQTRDRSPRPAGGDAG